MTPDDALKGEVQFSVSQFVAVLNQTLEYSYPAVAIVGELANLRVSKNKWVYFDLKDDQAIVGFFGTVYQLPGPLENGMMLKVRGLPRLHPQYGFKLNIQAIRPVGEGSIKKAADLLRAKLDSEGLFAEDRKRALPQAPVRIGLIASRQSAAFADFIKILNARWQGVIIEFIDVQVQGEAAPPQIIDALEQFNAMAAPPEVVVMIRGGGSAEDLAAFSAENVTRAVAASRVPTLVAIGHESDLSLAELAADRRASTPSNAAELLVPDRQEILGVLRLARGQIDRLADQRLTRIGHDLDQLSAELHQSAGRLIQRETAQLQHYAQLLNAVDPRAVLRRGYAIVRQKGKAIRSINALEPDAIVDVQLSDGKFEAATRRV